MNSKNNTVNPEDISAVIEQQRLWILKLQAADSKNDTILIKINEGGIPNGADPDLYAWKPYNKVWDKVKTPIYTRGILQNEIVIDADAKVWDDVRDELRKLTAFLDAECVSYTMGYSGGKGIHISILLTGITAGAAGKEISEGIALYNIDAPKIVRKAILYKVAELAGVDLEKLGLDLKKINFRTNSKGSQIREFGTIRSPGKYKTFITSIPETLPEPNELPLMFPTSAEKWDVGETVFNDVAINAIKQAIEKAKNSEEYTPIPDEKFKDISITEFPCVDRLYNAGITNGRYNACCSVVLMCKKCGISKTDTEKYLRTLGRTFPNISQEEIDQRILDSLRIYDSDHKFSCSTIKEDFPECGNLCNFGVCPIKEKLAVTRTEEAEKTARVTIDKALAEIKPSPIKAVRVQQMKEFISKYLVGTEGNLAEEMLVTKIKQPFDFNNAEFSLLKSHLKTEQKKLQETRKQREKAKQEYKEISFGETQDYAGVAIETLAADFKNLYRPVFCLGGQVYVYNNGVYETSDTANAEVKNFIYGQAKKHGICIAPANVDKVVKKIIDENTINPEDLTVIPNRLVVGNGILDVLTGELFPHDHKERHITKLNVTYDPTIEISEDFKGYLKTTFKGNEWETKVLQEMFGYCLLREYRFEVFFFLVGNGGNGRSTATNLLDTFLGEKNTCNKNLQEINNPSDNFSLIGLHGKMANICGETGVKVIEDFSTMKKATGRDMIEARYPYKPWIKFYNYAKMIFSMNQVPNIKDSTRGRRRRMKTIDFKNAFFDGVNADKGLEEKLTQPEALTGVLNWALAGLKRLIDNGEFSDIRSEAETAIDFDRKSNPVRHFVLDHVDEAGAEYENDQIRKLASLSISKVTEAELLQAYTAYGKGHNLPSIESKTLLKLVQSECEQVGLIVKRSRDQYKKGCIRQDFLKGIQLYGLEDLGIEPEKEEQSAEGDEKEAIELIKTLAHAAITEEGLIDLAWKNRITEERSTEIIKRLKERGEIYKTPDGKLRTLTRHTFIDNTKKTAEHSTLFGGVRYVNV